MLPNTRAPDLLQRFTPTPFTSNLNVVGRTIHVETNSLAVLEQVRRLLGDYNSFASERPEFGWRIVAEGGASREARWPDMTAFSQDGLSFASIGQRGFLAVDSKQREAVAFVLEELVNDRLGFSRPFLAMLFSLSSSAIGLTAIPAACVARKGNGLLIFGPSKSGKTLSSYLAERLGLQFHSDQVVFLEANKAGLQAWGEFWPTLFYEGAETFLTELPATAKRFHYQDRSWFYFEKLAPATGPRAVSPSACVFLDRHNGGTDRLILLQKDAFQKRLDEYTRLWDSASLQPDQATAWSLLGSLPAYHFSYGGHPIVPARMFQSLIEGHVS